MPRKSVLATAVVLAVSVLGTGTALGAETPGPQIQWVNNNVIVSALDHNVATVTAKYKCYGGEVGTHLWVSVKQGPNIDPATGHTSSSDAASWYDTNWNSTPDGIPLTTLNCNGQWQVTRTIVKKSAWGSFAQLQNGPAYVQFCAFDSSGSEETGFAFDYGMRNVHVPNN